VPVAVPGAVVQVFQNGTEAPIATTTADGYGNFSVSVETLGMAIDGRVEVDDPSGVYLHTVYYPRRPFDANWSVPIRMITSQQRTNSYGIVHLTWDSSQGTVLVLVSDCNGFVQDGATVTSTDTGANVVYFDEHGVLTTSAASTNLYGQAFVFNETSGATIAGGWMGHPLRDYQPLAQPADLTILNMQP
jgi:hypothetical protein